MKKSLFAIGLILSALLFSGCSKIKGYAVLLWNLPEYGLQDTDIVPVYIKSNISHVYVIGTSKGKVEIPLWQITEPSSKFKAKKTAKRFAEMKHQYAHVVMDGLPMRAEPVNTAKQVYRLRENESIKLLYKGKGQAVYAGKKPLEGDWMRVLTEDGTQGWCFSYNLRQYETDAQGQIIGGELQEEEIPENTELQILLQKVWYPDSYKAMIDTGRIDPSRINTAYNFHLDEITQRLSFNMPEVHEEWDYTGAEEDKTISTAQAYKLNDIPVIVSIRNDHYIVVRYTGESGKPEDFNLVTIEQDINELVSQERARREDEYENICLSGPVFKSASYGTLQLNEDHSFTWMNKNPLVPAVLTSSARNNGTVSIKYFLSKSLKQTYDGVLTFQFDGMKKEVNFFYKMEPAGLRFEDATGAVKDSGTFKERGLSPLVVFFSKPE